MFAAVITAIGASTGFTAVLLLERMAGHTGFGFLVFCAVVALGGLVAYALSLAGYP